MLVVKNNEEFAIRFRKCVSVVHNSVECTRNKCYNLTLPWLFKLRKDGSIVADIFIYIDDGKFLAITAW